MITDTRGREIIALHDVRGALVSANASLTNGTAGNLISGDADSFLDIVEISLALSTTVAGATVDVDLINDGTIVRTFTVPGGTVQINFDTPLKQITKNTPWKVDMTDVTGSPVAVGATLIKSDGK